MEKLLIVPATYRECRLSGGDVFGRFSLLTYTTYTRAGLQASTAFV